MEIKNKIKGLKLSKSLVLAVLVIILFSAGTYYALRIKTAPQDSQILAKLSTIILLPQGVTPTMAMVTDAGALKKQQPAFFANVKNGDRLIIYPDLPTGQAGLAIIYDYQANKIIKVGPVQNAPFQK